MTTPNTKTVITPYAVADGYILVWSAANNDWVPNSAAAIVSAGGGIPIPALGDVSGTYPTLKVIGIQGKQVSTMSPNTGQVLTWNGTVWQPSNVPGVSPATTTSEGIIQLAGDIGGTATSVTVTGLYGHPVASTTPTTNYVLTWNGSAWAPAVAAVGFTAGSDLTGTGTNQYVTSISGSSGSGGTVTLNINDLQFASGQTSATINQAVTSSTSGATLTVQAQGATGASHNGGALNLSSGTSGSATVGTVNVQTGGTTRLSVSPTNITIPAFTSVGLVHNDASGNLSSSLVVNADVSATANITVSKLAAGSAAQILLNNATPTPTWTTISGDVAITSTGATTVGAIQNRTIANTAPADGYVLTWSAVSNWWAPTAITSGSVTLSGDVIGAASTNTVVKILGTTLSSSIATIGASQDGYALIWVNANNDWEAKPVSSPEANLVGDVTGPETATSVVALRGKSLNSTLASLSSTQDGYVLTWDNTDGYWLAKPASGPEANLVGDVIGPETATVVSAIRGNTVSATTPTAGQVLIENAGATSSAWTTITGDGYLSTTTPGKLFVTGIDGYSVPIPSGSNTVLTYNGGLLSWGIGGGGSGITTLTGDVSASGTGTVSSTVIGLRGKSLNSSLSSLGSSQDGYVLTWDNTDGYWLARPSTGGSGGGINTSSNNLTTNVTLGNDPTFTDLATVTVTGTSFLVQAHAAGLTSNATMRLRVLIDGVENNYNGTYSTSGAASSGAVAADLVFVASGLSSSSHIFKLQGSYAGGSNITISAASNPTREGAWLVVTPTTSGGGSFTAAGDLSGTSSSQTVTGLRGKSLNASLASLSSTQDGYVLTWDNTDGYWLAKPGTGGSGSSFTAAGDLSGTSSSQTVTGLRGNSVPSPSGTYSTLLWNGGASSFSWSNLGTQPLRLTPTDGYTQVYWPLDESASPWLSYGAAGALNLTTGYGSPLSAQTGLFGNCVDFTNNSGLQTAETSVGESSSISISVWVWLRSYTSYGEIIDKRYQTSSGWSVPYTSIAIAQNNTTDGQWISNISVSGVSHSIVNSAGQFKIPLNEWVLLSATYDGTTHRTYINGNAAGTQTPGGAIDWGSHGRWQVGAVSVISAQSNDGKIDDVRIENTVRSQAYYQAMYKQGIGLADITTITDTNVSPTAAIQGTKISPNFGSQNIVTTGSLSTGSATTTSLAAAFVDVSGKLALEGITSSTLSNVGQGIILFDSGSAKFLVSQNDGYYVNLVGQDRNVNSSNITGSSYNALSTDDFLPVDSTSNAVTITLPAAPQLGKTYTIADVTGQAPTHNITVAGNGKTILGSSTFVISGPYNTLTITYNGTNWSII